MPQSCLGWEGKEKGSGDALAFLSKRPLPLRCCLSFPHLSSPCLRGRLRTNKKRLFHFSRAKSRDTKRAHAPREKSDGTNNGDVIQWGSRVMGGVPMCMACGVTMILGIANSVVERHGVIDRWQFFGVCVKFRVECAADVCVSAPTLPAPVGCDFG